MDLGVQALDLCLFLLDRPKISRVTATAPAGRYEVEDSANVLAEAEDGTTISIEVTWSYFGDADHREVRVMGTEGSASMPPLTVYKQLGGRPLDVTPRQPWPRGGEDPYTNSYRRVLDHFIRTVTSQADAPLPVDQAHLMAVIEAAYLSAEEGREVSLAPV